MEKMPNLDRTQDINIDYSPNLRKGHNKTLPMFLEDTASPFHSAIESGICRNFMEFDQNCNFLRN